MVSILSLEGGDFGFIAGRSDGLDQLVGAGPIRVVLDDDAAGVEVNFCLLNPSHTLESLLDLGHTGRARKLQAA